MSPFASVTVSTRVASLYAFTAVETLPVGVQRTAVSTRPRPSYV
jgi:hypothetical protein